MALLVVAVVTVGATIFFSLRADKKKSITVRYLGERALLSREGRNGAGLSVSFAGEQVDAPWLLSGRLENTGTLPIEARDVEKPIQLSFSTGKVIGAEITEKNQPAIEASAVHDKDSVTLAHALLNPGDFIGFNIIFDGKPGAPTASMRISGVPRVEQVVSSVGEKKSYATLFPLPTPILYLALILGSIVGLFLVGSGLFNSGREVVRFLWPHLRPRPAVPVRRSAAEAVDEAVKLWRIFPQPASPEARLIAKMMMIIPTPELADKPEELATIIGAKVSKDLLAALKVDARSAGALVSRELKNELRDRLATALYISLSSPDDKLAQEEMRNTEASVDGLIARAKQLAVPPSTETDNRPLRKIESAELVGGLLLLAVGAAFAVVLGGTWRTVLGI